MHRFLFASKVAIFHLLGSITIAAILAFLVFKVWYPYPLSEVTGSFELFWLVVGIDVICGPLLTLLLASPKKSKREMIVDLSLIILIQLSAFCYGMYHVFEARPVVVAFEVDRLRVLTPEDIDKSELSKAPEGYQQLPKFSHFFVGTRSARDGDDTLDAISKSLVGFDVGQRPSWWVPYKDEISTIKSRSLSIKSLSQYLNKDQKALLEKSVEKTGVSSEELFAIPLTTPKSTDWTALLDQKMQLVGIAPIDMFKIQDSIKKDDNKK